MSDLSTSYPPEPTTSEAGPAIDVHAHVVLPTIE